MYVCMYVCMCMCVCEKERDEGIKHGFWVIMDARRVCSIPGNCSWCYSFEQPDN
jgi:bacterioferritin-associated ferredoxin